ncbi:TetR/AcrR family transcriptional regulator [Embleya sp. NPDC059237]|uniref:TetR/AcrR family transcriptional regulator n=1 Tax=Embleya sp. NPDC059237 TaxID=3346784 RepID=UPI0036C022D9
MTTAPRPTPALAAAAVDRLVDPQRAGYLDDAGRLIAACRDLIAETGNIDPPVAAILQRAGLASRAFYRLFPAKQDLVMAVLEAATDALVASLAERLAAVTEPRARIDAWIDAFVARATSSPADGSTSLMIDAPRFAMNYPETAVLLERRIIAPIADALHELRPTVDSASVLDDAFVVYDIVASAVTRALSHRREIDADLLAHLHRSTARIIDSAP